MGIHFTTRQQLASINFHFSHAGYPVVWGTSERASRRELGLPYRKHAPLVPGLNANDFDNVAQRIGSCVICGSSVARRIRCLDFGTKRCAEHTFLVIGDMGLLPIREQRV